MYHRESLTVCHVTCPVCGGTQYIFYWRLGECVHCGAMLDGYGDGDYMAAEEERIVMLNPRTGELAVDNIESLKSNRRAGNKEVATCRQNGLSARTMNK